jgi:hypothetical protein
MPTQGVLLQPQDPGLVEVANDNDCNVMVIESDNDTDGADILHDNLLRDTIEQPKMLHERLSEAELESLGIMMASYEAGPKVAFAGQNGSQKPLHAISVMALLAEKEGIWGPFVVVALDHALDWWVHEVNALVPKFKVQSYWGPSTDRGLFRKSWGLKTGIYTQDSPAHVFVTSYQLVLSDAAYFQKMRWQFIILDNDKAMKSTKVQKIQHILGVYRSQSFSDESDGSQVNEPNTNQNVERPSETRGVRKRKAHLSRRSHERADGLEHLCKFTTGTYDLKAKLIHLVVPAQPAVGGNETDEMQLLRGIAFCLIRLNITILEARDDDHRRNYYSHFSSFESHYMNDLISPDEYNEGYPLPGIPMDGAREARLAGYINTYSREQIIQRIQDAKALPYLPKIFEHRLVMWNSWKVQKRMLENDPDFVIPAYRKEKSKSDYVGTCAFQYRSWHRRLRELYNITLQLRNFAIAACSSNLLDDISLRQLKAKMTALQPVFQETCNELELPREKLVWDSQTWW